ncbi:MAG: dTMP kinase [Alphaproteobacteria bacterium]|nr:dTMP kinase [Alphaproteobacteria bacterium]
MTSDRDRGTFITFEGGEGAGKTTQIRLLADRLRAGGHDVVTTREPGGATGADSIRALLVSGATDKWDPLSECLLLFAARREHLVKTIWPAMEQGAIVLCDRFADSTLAYQGYGHNVPIPFIEGLYASVVGDFEPDLTLILDLEVSVGLGRAISRNTSAASNEDRFEKMDPAFHERLRAGFLEIARNSGGRCVVIDADREPDTIAADIWDRVSERLSDAGAAA